MIENPFFPVTHSILSVDALMDRVSTEYDVGTLTDGKLVSSNMNDTYEFETANRKYILRAYRKSWRSYSDVLYELEALLHISKEGVAVSKPLPTKNGSYTNSVIAPEGIRYLSLFTYAPGKVPSYETEGDESYLYGKALARIHTATDKFQSQHRRRGLDLNYLLARRSKISA